MAVDDGALGRKWALEQPARAGDVACLDQTADFTRRDRRAAQRDGWNHLHGETEAAAQLPKQADVAHLPVPEPEILADYDGLRLKGVDQDLADERLRRQLRQFDAEGKNQNLVDAL